MGIFVCSVAAPLTPILTPFVDMWFTRVDIIRPRKNAEGITYEGRHYTGYEASQMQRQIERSIRKTKRELIGFDKAGLKDDFMTSSIKLRRQREYYDDFSNKAGLLKQNERAQVSGYGRRISGKTVWVEEKELERYSQYHYNRNGTIVVTDDWKSKNHPSTPSKYKPYAVIETKSEYVDGRVQINRSFYDGLARLNTQVHSSYHNSKKHHPYGKNGEHGHTYIWDEKGIVDRTTRELYDYEKERSKDIL